MAAMDEKESLTIAELAARVQKTVATVYRWNSTRTGPAYYRLGNSIRYRTSDVEAWLESRRVESGQPVSAGK